MTRGELRLAARRNDRDPQLIANFLARTLGDGSQGELCAEYTDPIFLVVLVPSLL
jgi:hypothetical protein